MNAIDLCEKKWNEKPWTICELIVSNRDLYLYFNSCEWIANLADLTIFIIHTSTHINHGQHSSLHYSKTLSLKLSQNSIFGVSVSQKQNHILPLLIFCLFCYYVPPVRAPSYVQSVFKFISHSVYLFCSVDAPFYCSIFLSMRTLKFESNLDDVFAQFIYVLKSVIVYMACIAHCIK